MGMMDVFVFRITLGNLLGRINECSRTEILHVFGDICVDVNAYVKGVHVIIREVVFFVWS